MTCAASFAAPDAQSQTRRQALFVRQQRQQPSAGYQVNKPQNPLEHEPREFTSSLIKILIDFSRIKSIHIYKKPVLSARECKLNNNHNPI